MRRANVRQRACTAQTALASNSLLEAIVYADVAAKDAIKTVKDIKYNTKIPSWNDEGTTHNEEMVLITQTNKEVEQILSNYVGIVRSNLRLKRALDRLELIYRETESLFDDSIVTKELCELRQQNQRWLPDNQNGHETERK